MSRVLFIFCLLFFASETLAHEWVIGLNERDIYRFKNAAGEWQGLDIELTDAIFNRTIHTYKIVAMPWPRVLQSLKSGTVDMTLAAAITPERAVYAYFSKHTFRFSHYVLYAQKSKLEKFAAVKRLADLANTDITIGALREAIYSETYEALMATPEFRSNIAFIDNDQNMADFALRGRVDGYIDSEIEGQYYLHKLPDYKSILLPLFRITSDEEAQSNLMFSRKTVTQAQVDEMDRALKALHDSGEYQRISDKYARMLTTQ